MAPSCMALKTMTGSLYSRSQAQGGLVHNPNGVVADGIPQRRFLVPAARPGIWRDLYRIPRLL